MAKKLFIDLELCAKCSKTQSCPAKLNYFERSGRENFETVRELATYATICRRCEDAACVAACTRDALEKTQDGLLKRYSVRCISCKSCSYACPFGTILPEFVTYLSSRRDFCNLENMPECTGCTEGAVRIEEIEPDISKNLYPVGKNIVVRAYTWQDERNGKKKK